MSRNSVLERVQNVLVLIVCELELNQDDEIFYNVFIPDFLKINSQIEEMHFKFQIYYISFANCKIILVLISTISNSVLN